MNRIFHSHPLLCSLAVVIVTLSAVQPAAAADIGFHGVELRGGLIDPDVFETTYGLGLGVNLGEVYDNLELHPGLFYFQTELDLGLFGNIDVDVLAAGAEVRYFLESDRSGWYFGGGPYLYDSDFSASGTSVDVSSSGVMGVVGYGLGSRLTVEGRYGTGFKHFGAYAVVRFGGGDTP